MGCKTVRVLLGRTVSDVVHMVTEILLKGIGKLTLCTVYPGPSRLISHFELSDVYTTDDGYRRTSPLPSSILLAGRQHTPLECNSISR